MKRYRQRVFIPFQLRISDVAVDETLQVSSHMAWKQGSDHPTFSFVVCAICDIKYLQHAESCIKEKYCTGEREF